jgi:uncharacterized protein YfkK (UPF0435 family)
MRKMNLKENSRENIELMITSIKERLNVANSGAMRPESFDTDNYPDLVDIYEMIMSKTTFSISEIDAIVSELGKLRKKTL